MQRASSSLRRSLGALRLRFNGNIAVQDCSKWISSRKLITGCRCINSATKVSDFTSGRGIYSRVVQDEAAKTAKVDQADGQLPQASLHKRVASLHKCGVGKNVSAVDKRKFLINTLLDLKDSKQAVYGTLDAWVAWEHNFPLVSLKRALLVLQKEEQWHRIVQVIKWMLSKGQGTTMGTYEQLIRALEKDGRAEEAHQLWVKKISHDLHSVPWTFCELMISIYYRNNMLSRLVKLFKGLESYERRPPYKSIVQKVADAYEMLGILEEKNRVLEKYSDLFSDAPKERFKESRKGSRKNQNKAGKEKNKVKEANENFEVDSGPSNEEVV
ncbi:pentatricopeptide repeat-containing protein At4g21190 [Asparagus officinalis]|uniref:pentatricopeptide repeat-containing protein At4g21190 n=1 Tax=Asparagus officinalis TaxID=4686 RepID=UPI00098E8201|nr:pentatricopeptide repeat-containing protein At4g21190 [Asparagus officinalis]